jgi:hypothetical protein
MPDYTPNMIQRMRAAQPLNLEKCKALAADFGISHRSVISKAKAQGFDYRVATPVAKQVDSTKAEINAAIRKSLSLANRSGDLVKAELEAIWEHLG